MKFVVKSILKSALFAAVPAFAIFAASGPALAGNFSLTWGTAPYTWTPLSLGPNNFTLTDQHGFQATARFTITRNNGSSAGNFPDDLLTDGGINSFGTQVSIWQVWNPNLTGGGIGGSTNTLVLQLRDGTTALPVNGLAFNVSDIDAVDSNSSGFASDRCDHLTFTGNAGNPTLAPVTGSRVFLMGPGPGAGASPALAANQVQCDFRVSTAVTSPSSNGDDNGTVRASYPNGTHTATVAYDESIHNVSGITTVNALARGVGAWSGLSFSTTNSISLDKQTTATEFTATGQTITYTYVVTNTGPMTINSGQNIQIQDDKIGTFTCGTIPAAGIAPGGTHSCTANYTVTAADVTTGSVTNTAIAGVGTGTQAFSTRLQSNSDAVTVPGRARLTLVKTVTNDNGGTQPATAWTLVATGPVTVSGTSGSGTVTNAIVNPGTYALSETGPTGYTAGTWSCTAGSLSGANLTLAVGQNATCTINNNDVAPRLTLVKTITGDTTPSSVPLFTLSASGPVTISGVTGASAVTNAAVSAGSYALSESSLPEYSAAAWSCSAGTLSGSTLTLSVGQVATCTINNTRLPTVSVQKITTGGFGGLFSFTDTNISGTFADINTTAANSPTPASPTALVATLGSPASITESTSLAWVSGAVTCTDANATNSGNSNPVATGSAGAVTIPAAANRAGAIITCVFTNAAAAPQLTVTKSASPGTVSAAGQSITYTIAVQNPGNVTLTNVTLTDPLGSVTCPSSGTNVIASLAPAASQNCSLTYAATQADFDSNGGGDGDIDNTATAATTYNGNPVSGAGSAAVTLTLNPSFVIIKEATPTSGIAVGGTVNYTYRVRNNGNQTITGITVSDVHNGFGTAPVPGSEVMHSDAVPLNDSSDSGSNGVWDSLRPGDEIRFTASYVVRQQDIDLRQ